MMRRMVFSILLTGMALAGCTAQTSPELEPERAVWRVGETEITGRTAANGVAEFRGIPYARPPVGSLRWRAPQPLISTKEPVDAGQFGPACPQGQGNPNWYRTVAKGFGADPDQIADLEDISEDCLTLNVWSSGADGSAKPVMVWIHGGSNINGFSHEPNYRGHNLAARDVVVVSVNYRMGALGFLPHPALDEEDPDGVSGYYGLADQIAALQWVQSNIAAFGGDPKNVTVFGESAGGGNISALLRMPSAKGLFQRAAIQSGALGPYDAIDYKTASMASQKLFDTLGALSADQMRAVPWQEIVDRTATALPDHYFGPVVDGVHLSGAKITNAVPLLIGANADEMLMYLARDEAKPFQAALAAYAPQSTATIAAYFDDSDLEPLGKANRLSSAVEFFCPTLDLARQVAREGAPVFVYYFTRTRPGGTSLGAYHGAEIPYVFDTRDDWLPLDEADIELTETMGSYWANFAQAGDPNGPGLAQWQRFDPVLDTMQELGVRVAQTSDNPASLCSLLSQTDQD